MEHFIKPYFVRKALAMLAVLVMVIANIGGNLVYAVNEQYPDFEVSVTSKESGGNEIGVGSTIIVRVDFDKVEDGGLDMPFTHSIYVHEEYVKNSNAVFVSQQLEDPEDNTRLVPIFQINKSDLAEPVPEREGNYFRYDIQYNAEAHGIDDSMFKAFLEMYLQLSKENLIIDIEEPILVETDSGFIVHKPEIIDNPLMDFTIEKRVTKQFRMNNETNLYETISSDGYKKLQVGDVFEFTIYIKNDNLKPVTIGAGMIKDLLPVGYTYMISSELAKVTLEPTIKGARSKWVMAEEQNKPGYNIYENVDEYRDLAPSAIVEYYIYAKADIGNIFELQNIAEIYESSSTAGPKYMEEGPFRYDMAVTTYFSELYYSGKDKIGNQIQTLADADAAAAAGNVFVKYGHVIGSASSAPYVENGDVLRLRTFYYNQSSESVANVKLALYGLFEGQHQVYEILDCKHNLEMIPNTYQASPQASWENPNISIRTLLIPDTIRSYSIGSFDILVKVVNYPNTNYHDRSIYAEVVSFEDAANPNVTVEDNDSYNDSNPYNDMTYNNEFKERDNVISESTKSNPAKDEDDFDYAFVRNYEEYDPPAKVDLSKEISKATGELIYGYSKSLGRYTYSHDYKHLPSNKKLIDPYTYIAYKIVINSGGAKDLQDVELTDVLPKGLTFLTDDNGKFVYSFRLWEGKDAYEGRPFPINDSNLFSIRYFYPWDRDVAGRSGVEVNCDTAANTLTLKTERLQHKMLVLYLLTKVDTNKIDYNVSYTNSVVLKAIGQSQKTESAETVIWDAASAAVFVKKYVDVNGEWIETGSETVNKIPVDAGEFSVNYRIKILNLSTGGGFAKGSLNVRDDLGAKVKSITNTKMSGKNDRGVLTNEEVSKIFTAEVNNGKVFTVKNDKSAVPAANAEYYFDFTAVYHPIEQGECVINQLYGKSVYTVKPLELEFIKTDMAGNRLDGSEFLLEYDDEAPVKDVNGFPIIIAPGAENGKAIFIPRDYQKLSQWNLVLKEIKSPSGYIPRTYKFILIKDASGKLQLTMEYGEDGYVKFENNHTITLKNEKKPETEGPKEPTDPTDPAGPTEPTDPEDTTEPEEGTTPPEETKPTDPTDPVIDIPDLPFPYGPAEPTEPTEPSDILEMLEDDRIPLGAIEVGNEIAIGIEDDEIPLGSMDGDLDDVPKTGDTMMIHTSVLLLMIGFFISMAGIVARIKKYRNKDS